MNPRRELKKEQERGGKKGGGAAILCSGYSLYNGSEAGQCNACWRNLSERKQVHFPAVQPERISRCICRYKGQFHVDAVRSLRSATWRVQRNTRCTLCSQNLSLSLGRQAPLSFRDQRIKWSREHPPGVTASPCIPPATKSSPSSSQPPPHNKSYFLKSSPLVFLFRGGYPKGDKTLLPATAPLVFEDGPLVPPCPDGSLSFPS